MEPASVEVSFQDEQLEQAIKQRLKKDGNAVITQQDMESLTVVDLSKRGITSLQGLQYASNLTHLDLSNNKIGDIMPLKPLTKIRELDISGNRISDLRALEGMTRLRSLSANHNQIKKLDPLKQMSNLGSLNLSSNFIYNLEPLKSLKEIHYLYLSDNRIWNLDPIRYHTFDTHYDTGALRYALQLNGNYLDLRSTTKTYQLLNKLGGEGYPGSQLKAQRLVIGSKTAFVGERSYALSTAPFIASSRTYVPIRFVSEQLGSKVRWNQSKKEVTIRKDNTTIRWKVNEKKATVNGKIVSLDAPLLLKKNSSFIPVRFVSELLGSPVEYMANPKTVIVFEQK